MDHQKAMPTVKYLQSLNAEEGAQEFVGNHLSAQEVDHSQEVIDIVEKNFPIHRRRRQQSESQSRSPLSKTFADRERAQSNM
jgi:hypothetical protein